MKVEKCAFKVHGRKSAMHVIIRSVLTFSHCRTCRRLFARYVKMSDVKDA